MLNNYFKDFEQFKEIFELRRVGEKDDGSPKYARRNKIFLDSYKTALANGNAELFRNLFKEPGNDAFFEPFAKMIYSLNGKCLDEFYTSKIEGTRFCLISKKMKFDHMKGLCEDGDVRSIRYVNTEQDKVYKMKAGKFMRAILVEAGAEKLIGESALNYMCEVFSQEWQAYAIGKIVSVRLNVDLDFEFIYNSNNYNNGGSFGSCMSDAGHHEFYNNAVDARAASIIDTDGKIMARCIIYDNVFTGDGKKISIAERQYGISETYKQVLVDFLVANKYIDAYKAIGSDCHAADNFVRLDGESNKEFKIRCDLRHGDDVSYQDSFKWYHNGLKWAYNYEAPGTKCDLDTTEGNFEGGENYDEYHDEWTDEDVLSINVWSNLGHYSTQSISLSSLESGDFFYSETTDEYYDEAYYSELLEDYLPKDKYEEIENGWKEDNWPYDSTHREHVKNIIEVHIWNGRKYLSETDNEDNEDEYLEYEGELYDELSDEGCPLDMIEETVANEM